MEFLIVIPARLGSTRLPEKPLKMVLGKPLILWVLESAFRISNNVVVATDSEEVKSIVEKAGGVAVITSSDLPSGTDRVAEAVKLIGKNFDYIVNVQGDEPFVEKEHVLPVVRRLLQGDRFATVAVPFDSFEDVKNPNNVKVVLDKDSYGVYFSRSVIPYDREGVLKPCNYLKHIGIYGFRRDALFDFVSWEEGTLEKVEKLEQLRILERGEKIAVSVVNNYIPGVDTVEDLKKMENYLKERMDGC